MAAITMISSHGWTSQLESLLQTIRTEDSAFWLNNAIAVLTGDGTTTVTNPNRVGVENNLRHLCAHLGLPPSDRLFARSGIGRLAALCYPDAAPNRLRACTMVMLLALLFDDALERKRASRSHFGALASALLTALDGDDPGAMRQHALVRLAREIHTALQAIRPSRTWLARFRAGMEGYFGMAVKEYERWLESGGSLPFNCYLDERYHDIGVGPMLAMAELASEIELPARTFRQPEIASLHTRCIFSMVFMNDVFSYHREVIELGNLTNSIAVVQMQFGLSFGQAVAAAVLLARQCQTDFAERAARVMQDASIPSQGKRYVQAMQTWMSGALQWSRESERYRHPDSPLPELRHVEQATKRADAALAPVASLLHRA